MSSFAAGVHYSACRAEVFASGGEPVWGSGGVLSFLLPASALVVIAVGLWSMWMARNADPEVPPNPDGLVVRMVLCAAIAPLPLSFVVPALQTGIIDTNSNGAGIEQATYRCDPEMFVMEIGPLMLMFVFFASALLFYGAQWLSARRREKARPRGSRWRRSSHD